MDLLQWDDKSPRGPSPAPGPADPPQDAEPKDSGLAHKPQADDVDLLQDHRCTATQEDNLLQWEEVTRPLEQDLEWQSELRPRDEHLLTADVRLSDSVSPEARQPAEQDKELESIEPTRSYLPDVTTDVTADVTADVTTEWSGVKSQLERAEPESRPESRPEAVRGDDEGGQLLAPACELRGESPEQVVATVTEKLRLIMEHLEHGVQHSVQEGVQQDAVAARESPSSDTLSSRESRQRLMDRLFGMGESTVESECSMTSLKSSALDLGDLGDLASDLASDILDDRSRDDDLGQRARSAAGDVEGVTASSRLTRYKLDRQNSERAMRIIRENSEILQRISVWQRDGRSLTLPERSEPPDFLTSSPIKKRAPTLFEADDCADSSVVDSSTVDSAALDSSRLAAEEEDTFPLTLSSSSGSDPLRPSSSRESRSTEDAEKNGDIRVGLSRTLSREKHPKRFPDLPLPKQTSLDESRYSSSRPAPTDKLQLILDQAFSSLEASLSNSVQTSNPALQKPSNTLSTTKPKYKFPEMSPMTTSPLQPLPGTNILRPPSEGQPRKWRPELSPPSTPVHPAGWAPSDDAEGLSSTSYHALRKKDDAKPTLSSKSPTHDRRPVVSSVTIEGPTTLPVQTPSFPREGPSSPTSPHTKQTGRRKKASYMDKSPDEAGVAVPTSGLRSPITFNPFPSRTNTRQPKEIGVKLGLYPSSTSTK